MPIRSSIAQRPKPSFGGDPAKARAYILANATKEKPLVVSKKMYDEMSRIKSMRNVMKYVRVAEKPKSDLQAWSDIIVKDDTAIHFAAAGANVITAEPLAKLRETYRQWADEQLDPIFLIEAVGEYLKAV